MPSKSNLYFSAWINLQERKILSFDKSVCFKSEKMVCVSGEKVLMYGLWICLTLKFRDSKTLV